VEPAAVQAYCGIFLDVHDRINATAYIIDKVIGLTAEAPPTPVMLFLLAAYHHGPMVIEPWLGYLRDGDGGSDLTSSRGRMVAAINLLIGAQSLPDDAEVQMSLLRRLPCMPKNERKSASAITATSAFRKSTAALIDGLDLPPAELEPCSYAPNATAAPDRAARRQNRKAA
jgi:hypothetical protein